MALRGNQKLGQPKSARRNGKVGSLSSRAWWAMRRMQQFTKPDLLNAVARADETAASNVLGGYLRALHLAGILSVEPQRVAGKLRSSNGFIRYRLEIDCGHKSPIWRIKAKQVYDPNHEITYEIGEAQHA